MSYSTNIRVLNYDPEGGADQPRSKVIDYMKSSENYVGARFIFECASKLNLESVTVATAASLFHSFYAKGDKQGYDMYLIAAACLYLSGKLEEPDQLKVRDLINVVHSTLHREAEPLNCDSEYYNMRDAICQAELFLLRAVGFNTKFSHPHKYLLHYLVTLKQWMSEEVWRKYPIAKTSWAILQDSYHDVRVLCLDKPLFSVACIAIALQTFGIQVPYTSETRGKNWYQVFSETITKDSLWETMTLIMDIYNKDSVFIAPISK